MTFDIVNAVLAILVILSVAVWGIVIHKGVLFYRGDKNNKKFIKVLDEATQIGSLTTKAKNIPGSLARICHAGLLELQTLQNGAVHLSKSTQQELVLHALRMQVSKEQGKMEQGLGVLASVGAIAPFIGLFGTVWGIMNALKDISKHGSASLEVVAGPIGEALIATAIGIATAIPAVLAYNYFMRRLKANNNQIENCGATLRYLMQKSGLGE